MNFLQLKAELVEAIGDDLGEYTTADGVILPAITITPPQVPSGYSCNGLECIIQGEPEERAIGVGTGDSLAFEYWVVRLIQWDTSKKLYPVKQKIRRHFLNRFPMTTTDIPPSDLNYAQCVIRISDPIWINQGR